MITTQQLFPLKQFSTESSESFSPTPPHNKTSMGAMFGETVGYTSSPRKPKRRMNEDRLGPFTDYSSRRRPPFQRAITIAAPGSAGHEFSIIRSGNNINQLASDFSSQTPSGRRDSKTSLGSRGKRKESIGLASDLYNRRKMKALNKFKEADTPLKTKRSKGGRVTFSHPPSKEPSPIPPVKTVSTDRDYSKLESTSVRNTDEPVAERWQETNLASNEYPSASRILAGCIASHVITKHSIIKRSAQPDQSNCHSQPVRLHNYNR